MKFCELIKDWFLQKLSVPVFLPSVLGHYRLAERDVGSISQEKGNMGVESYTLPEISCLPQRSGSSRVSG